MNAFQNTLKAIIAELVKLNFFDLESKEIKIINQLIKSDPVRIVDQNYHYDESDDQADEEEDVAVDNLVDQIQNALYFFGFITETVEGFEISQKAEDFLISDDKEYDLAEATFMKRLIGTKYPEELIAGMKHFVQLSEKERQNVVLVLKAGYLIDFDDVPDEAYHTFQKLRRKIQEDLGKNELKSKDLFRHTRIGIKELYTYDLSVLKRLTR